jgi:hypothetical protein
MDELVERRIFADVDEILDASHVATVSKVLATAAQRAPGGWTDRNDEVRGFEGESRDLI